MYKRGRAHAVSATLLGWTAATAVTACDSGRVSEHESGVTVGDTVVVESGLRGTWSVPYTLAPTVSIGSEEAGPEYVFGGVTSLATDPAGNIYVLDVQAAAIRAFDSEGAYFRTIGRRGRGPGELASPTAIAVLSDGRVLASDAGNARVQVFSPSGEPADEWPVLNPSFSSFSPLWVDAWDRTFIVTKERSADIIGAATIVLVVGSDGSVEDTVPEPTALFDPPILEATFQSGSGYGVASAPLPFGPRATWSLHPDGSVVRGFSTRYRIELLSGSGAVRRIEKGYDPVPVLDEERAFHRERLIASMRSTDPDWSWTGPPIPTEKPPFKRIFSGRDGRLWVWLSNPGIEVENPSYDPELEGSPPVVWDEAVSFDVFDADGTYLGRVDAPKGFSVAPAPVFDSGGAWSVTRDDLGVERVVRFELRPNDGMPQG